MRELRELIQHMINDSLVPVTAASVISVNKQANTCVVKVTGTEEEYNDVRLLAIEGESENPTVMYPKENSVVLIAPLFGSKSEWAVILVTEVDEILLNGNEFGGLVKADVLKTELDKTNALVSAIKNTLLNWTPAAGDGGAALKLALFPPSGVGGLHDKTVGDFSSIKNDKVKHG